MDDSAVTSKLSKLRATIRNEAEIAELHGIEYLVPPVPNGAMDAFVKVIKEFQEFSEAYSTINEEGKRVIAISELDMLSKSVPFVEQLRPIFHLTVSSLDQDISEEEVELALDATNFLNAKLALMRATGLLPKQRQFPGTQAEPAQKLPTKKSNGPTTKS